jgi:hypothetical protein
LLRLLVRHVAAARVYVGRTFGIASVGGLSLARSNFESAGSVWLGSTLLQPAQSVSSFP